MNTTRRQFVKACRAGLRHHIKTKNIPVPFMLRPEFAWNKRFSQKRDIYLERIGSGNFSRLDVRIYQRAQRQRRRRELGFYMCKARFILCD